MVCCLGGKNALFIYNEPWEVLRGAFIEYDVGLDGDFEVTVN